MSRADDIRTAAEAVRDGKLVVYPTETVYGLGADALNPDAIEAVFEAKGRDRDNPISLGVPAVEDVSEYTVPTALEEAFMDEFLPGPVTVLLERKDIVPDILTNGRDQVGIRVPDHPVALDLLEEAAPLTATSANISGQPSVRRVEDLDEITESVAVVLDGGETDGTGSTVVDVEAGEIYREGTGSAEIEAWLAER